MADLPERARRAGAAVALTDLPESEAPYDLILADAPCSGSGSWRRDPEGKWNLTQETLDRTVEIQRDILDRLAPMVREGGILAYATCSLLDRENSGQARAFLARHPEFALEKDLTLTPMQGGDGFFLAIFRRS